jgi:hypothetical protein
MTTGDPLGGWTPVIAAGVTLMALLFAVFSRHPGDKSLWSPPAVPAGYQEAIAREPDDPQYRPAP